MSGVSNPFVQAKQTLSPETSPDIRDDLMGSTLFVGGPTQPGLSLHLEAPLEAWETRNVGPLEGVAVMGLHGGAGASTLATLLGGSASDIGRAWPISMNTWTGNAWPTPVIAVARNDHSGIEATDRFIRSWASGKLTGSLLSALVIIDASPKLSDGRKRATKRLLRMVPRGTHIPWIDAWLDAPPDPARIPGRIKKIIRVLNTPSPTT
ncbi:hypothetical protein GCM10009628_03870 [Paeniglutamicibacter kerguelensis]